MLPYIKQLLSIPQMKPVILFKSLLSWILLMLVFQPLWAQQVPLIQSKKIWDQAPHNALISSTDGADWQSQVLLAVPDYDLRDPKLSVTPDNRLMVLMGAADYQGKEVMDRKGMVSFSTDGLSFTEPAAVAIDARIANDKGWLWRVNWHQGTGYGVLYQNHGESSNANLLKTSDGLQYQLVTDLGIEGKPNEATIKVLPDNQMVMIIRREGGNTHGMLGRSQPPYREWQWQDMGMRLGGPDFVLLPHGQLLLGSRVYGESGARTGLYLGQLQGQGHGPSSVQFKQIAVFPSAGDTSYPGMVLRGDTVYISYYSSHQEKTAIYFASVSLMQLTINN